MNTVFQHIDTMPLWLFWLYVVIGALALYGLFTIIHNTVITVRRKRRLERNFNRLFDGRGHDKS
jgi:succinylglutamate desuccinylase